MAESKDMQNFKEFCYLLFKLLSKRNISIYTISSAGKPLFPCTLTTLGILIFLKIC